ncbi:MAG: CoA pyrophosphatase [Bacteroidetes bacterium]|nr:MAG: CoA pyrophosphatase [Bacteroidota bacterium]
MESTPEFISSIKQSLARDLPGKAAQFEMAAVGRPEYHTMPRDDIRSAAVLIALYEKDANWHTIVMKRKSHPGDRHGGQISFPGGKQEIGEVLSQTAVRESHEEVGTPLEGVQVIGQLTQLHIPISNFMVYPFVGYLDAPAMLSPQLSEVDQIFEIPVSSFLAGESRQKKDLRIPEGVLLRNVPYFDIADQVIWGATAMIMSEFVAVVRSISDQS